MNNSEKIKLTDDICKTFDSHGLVIQDGEMVEKINALVSDLIEMKNENEKIRKVEARWREACEATGYEGSIVDALRTLRGISR